MFAAAVTGSLMAAPANAEPRKPDPQPTGGSVSGNGRELSPAVDWGSCPKDVTAVAPQLQCATVPVPMDYTKPNPTKIKIMISRLASQKPAQRRGVLLLNPGGPGGAGLTQPADLATLGIPSSVLDSYDLIGMDPRGIGHSAPVSCGFTSDQDYRGNIPPYAADAAAVVKQAEAAEKVADQCAAQDQQRLMRNVTTANTARDMDRIRIALGEQKINYFGVSYGSALGAAYASMFAERTDRVLLDSNVGGTSFDRGATRRLGLGAEQRFGDFAEFAAARDASYGLGRTPAKVRKNYFTLAKRLDRKSVAGIDGAYFRLSVFGGLYSDRQFAPTAQLWQQLASSDDAGVRRQLAEYPALRTPGLPSGSRQKAKAGADLSPYDNAWSAFLAVSCNDSSWSDDLDSYQRDVANDREQYPLFGAAGANISPCAFWHGRRAEPVQISDDGPSNVLLLQNLRDPATPLIGGKMFRTAFGDRARLVTIDQGGHGAYVYNDNPCGLDIATRYLVDGKRPAKDTFCPASQQSGLKLDRAGQQRRAEALDRLGR